MRTRPLGHRVGALRRAAGVNSGVQWNPLLLGSSLLWWWDFSPGYIWQDTSRTTPATSEGHEVAAVTDRSGNGRHLSQAVALLRPTVSVDYFSFGPMYAVAVNFDGTDDFYSIANPVTNGTSPQSGVIAFNKNTSNTGVLIGGVLAAAFEWYNNGLDKIERQDVATIGTSTANSPAVQSNTSAFTWAGSGGNWAFYLNGLANGSGGPVTSNQTTATDQFGKGGGSHPLFEGAALECIGVNRVLTGPELQQAHYYLKAKWKTA